MDQPVSPTRHEREIRFANMKLMKQQILDIRERKQAIPKMPEPQIVQTFEELYLIKANEIKKTILLKRIEEKQKQYKKLIVELQKYKQKYGEKQKAFKQKEHIFKALTEKLEMEYEKTKAIFRDVGFNRAITTGVRKLNYYKVAELLLNENARRVFSALQSMVEPKESNAGSQMKTQQEVGICLGYLGLLISMVGQISGARLWFDFVFRGSKSVVRLSDDYFVVLRPRETRFSQGMNVLVEQLQQIMQDTMGLKVPKSRNLYQMCEQLCKHLLG